MNDPADDTASLRGHLLKGRYLVLDLIGEGGMGSAWLAEDRDLRRRVVVKAPRVEVLADRQFRVRFDREVQHLLGLDHPHVTKVLDAGADGVLPFLVLPYLAGGSLQDRLQASGGRIGLDAVLAWLPDVARALDFIHRKGFVHRDVKPGNIMFDEAGNAFLGDFGIARAVEGSDAGLTQTGAIVGSPRYLAPEIALGQQAGPSSDQYSLATIVYVALSGALPHVGDTPLVIVAQKTMMPPRPLADAAPGIAEGVAACVMRSLSREPDVRFPSCEAFASALALAARGAAMPVSGGQVAEAAAPPADTLTLAAGAPSASASAASTTVVMERGRARGATTEVVDAGGQAHPAPTQRRRRALVSGLAIGLAAAVVTAGWFALASQRRSTNAAADPVAGESVSRLDLPPAPAAPPGASGPTEAGTGLAATSALIPDAVASPTAPETAASLRLDEPIPGDVTAALHVPEAPILPAAASTVSVPTSVATPPPRPSSPTPPIATPPAAASVVPQAPPRASPAPAAPSQANRQAAPAISAVPVLQPAAPAQPEPPSDDAAPEPVASPPARERPTAPAPARLLALGPNALGFDQAERSKDGALVILVQGGRFRRGSSQVPDEGPESDLAISSFWLDEAEVTWSQWRAYMRANGIQLERSPSWAPGPDHPVVNVDWDGAARYCAWAGGRLPTEAEWEFAARGTSSRSYPWGNAWRDGLANWSNAQDGHAQTAPVGSFPAGAGPFGHLDLAGNAAEWVADWYDPRGHSTGALRDPRGPSSGTARVVRGGSFSTKAREALRGANRAHAEPGTVFANYGFRCAMEP